MRGPARVWARGRVQRAGKVRGLLPVRRLGFLTGGRHLPARPGSGSGQPVARRRLGGGAGAGAEPASSRSRIAAARARGSSCLGAAGQEQSLGGGGGDTRPRERAPGAAPRQGRRRSSLASWPRQLSGPVLNDGELPRPGNDRRRVLWARVQGAPEAQRPGEERGLGLCSLWPELISGASWVLRLCQDFGNSAFIRLSVGVPDQIRLALSHLDSRGFRSDLKTSKQSQH